MAFRILNCLIYVTCKFCYAYVRFRRTGIGFAGNGTGDLFSHQLIRQYSSWRRKTGIQHALLAVYVYLCRFRFFYALLGVAEWAYYYQTPGLNIAPRSQQALEFSVPYSFFHWGISAWATYTLASLIMAYHFHVRKNKGLSLSGIIAAITGVRPQGPWGKLVDLMFLIATVGALTISLVVTAATFTRGLSALTGLPDNFTVQAFVILLSGGIFA